VLLQRSYSAPVRVSEILTPVVALRSGAMFLPRLSLLLRGVALRDVTLPDVVALRVATALRAVPTLLRGDNVVVRADVVRFGVVEMRDCVEESALDGPVPSRTAASETPMQTNKLATKNRIFFISDRILANLRFLAQANNRISS